MVISGGYSDKSTEHSPAVSRDPAKVMGRPAQPLDPPQDGRRNPRNDT